LHVALLNGFSFYSFVVSALQVFRAANTQVTGNLLNFKSICLTLSHYQCCFGCSAGIQGGQHAGHRQRAHYNRQAHVMRVMSVTFGTHVLHVSLSAGFQAANTQMTGNLPKFQVKSPRIPSSILVMLSFCRFSGQPTRRSQATFQMPGA
jgi:hypothetical protein